MGSVTPRRSALSIHPKGLVNASGVWRLATCLNASLAHSFTDESGSLAMDPEPLMLDVAGKCELVAKRVRVVVAFVPVL